jgi:hypothetical protein
MSIRQMLNGTLHCVGVSSLPARVVPLEYK